MRGSAQVFMHPLSSSQARTGLDLTARHDEQLAVERVRAGDALALEVIFVAYRAELLAVAERVTRSQAVAEEVVQDVFLAIWTGRAHWHITTSLAAYLHRAVHNVASRAVTSHTRGGTWGDELSAAARRAPESFRDPAPEPDERAEGAALSAAVTAATRDMPARARDVFALRREGELSNREIATALGLSVKTVESHMHRALTVLRQQLAAWKR
jgi:RNA polymerase sigma-70 factor, ECF subfamily